MERAGKERSDKGGAQDTNQRSFGANSLLNPLWCYHGFRMAVVGLSVSA